MPSPENSSQSDRTDDSTSGRRVHRRAQLAAVGALIAAVFLVWLTVSLVANDPVGLVISFVAVFLVAFSVWFLVTRRGIVRLLVLPLAFFALIALVTYAHDQKYMLIVLGVGLVGGSVTLTRRNPLGLLRIAAGKPTVAPSQR